MEAKYSNIDSFSDAHSPHFRQSVISGKVKNLFNQYVLRKDLELDPESFRDDSIWGKLMQVSLKEWNNEFNEGYIMHLLSNFDTDQLIFNKYAIQKQRKYSDDYSNPQYSRDD